MSDSHTVTTTRSWGSRLGDSLKGVLIGLLMFIASFPLLWWNEGRTQKRHLALLEGAAVVVSVPHEVIDPDNEGKLIYTSGIVASSETLHDQELDVSREGVLQLRREVEMYQWHEKSSTSTEKNLGGSETTTTTYSYSRDWSSNLISSGSFSNPTGHQNPLQMDYAAQTLVAQQAQLGAFHVRPDEVKRLTGFRPVSLEGKQFPMISRSHQILGDWLYLGNDPSTPAVGDIRIKFSFVPDTTATFVAKQQGLELHPYMTKNGGRILLLKNGEATVDDMFAAAQGENSLMAWVLRGAGFLLMFVGLRMVFAPLSVLGDVVPAIGTLIGMGFGVVAFLIALPLTLITIALAWIFYRPLLAGILLAVAVASFVVLWKRRKKKRTVPETTSADIAS